MSEQLNVIYQIADGGPFHLEVENGVAIENITDDLVNAGILVPVTEDLLTRAEWEASIDYESDESIHKAGIAWDVADKRGLSFHGRLRAALRAAIEEDS